VTRKRRKSRSRQERRRIHDRTQARGLINRYVDTLFRVKDAFAAEASRMEREFLALVVSGTSPTHNRWVEP
jgi:hypothetical protein